MFWTALLDRLASEKLEDVAAPYREQGWKWVETAFQRPDWIFNMPRIYPEDVELSAEDQAEYDALVSERDDLAELIDNDENAGQRVAEIDKRLDELSKKQEAYQPDDMARSGVVVFVNHHGKAQAEIGIVREEDEIEEADEAESDENEDSTEDGEDIGATANTSTGTGEPEERTPTFTHPQPLIEVLTAKKTAALRVELANNPDVALAAVVHAMLLRISYGGRVDEKSALQVSLTHEHLNR